MLLTLVARAVAVAHEANLKQRDDKGSGGSSSSRQQAAPLACLQDTFSRRLAPRSLECTGTNRRQRTRLQARAKVETGGEGGAGVSPLPLQTLLPPPGHSMEQEGPLRDWLGVFGVWGFELDGEEEDLKPAMQVHSDAE